MTDKITKIAIAMLTLENFLDCRLSVNLAEFAEICEQVELQNGMTRKTLRALVQQLSSAFAAEYGGSNPNNGHNPVTIFVGKAGTFFIEAHLYKAYFAPCGGRAKIKAGFDEAAVIAHKGGADEVDVWEDDGDLHLRVWWD